MTLKYIAFDADDTLWHNETLFKLTHDKFSHLLADFHPPELIEQKLFETEMKNLHYFGYGIKGFTLSMIETAIQLTEGRVTGKEIQKIINFAREMIKAPVELLEHVQETIQILHKSYKLLLITKGDLFDQESKIARSGLSDYFLSIEILTRKDNQQYLAVLNKHSIQAGELLMVGNSLKSDILPVLELGGKAAFVPYQLCWEHEKLAPERLAPFSDNYFELQHIGQLCQLIKKIN